MPVGEASPRLTCLPGRMGETDVDLWLWSALAYISMGRDSWSQGCPRLAVGVFCLSLKLREGLSRPCTWGRRKKSGQQEDYRMLPNPLPNALAKSPLRWGQVTP